MTERLRVVNPSPAAWEALGTTLSVLVEAQGLVLSDIPKSFIFDISKVFAFDFVPPYPSELGAI